MCWVNTLATRKAFLAIGAAALVSGCDVCPGQWTAGALMASGGSMQSLDNRNGALYSMHGFERVSRSELKPVALFHALILAPEFEGIGSGSAFSSECVTGAETLTWEMAPEPGGEARNGALTMGFDGTRRVLTVGDQTVPAAPHNVFVIHLDDAWRARVEPAGLTIAEPAAGPQVLARLKAALPRDKDVQHARLRNEDAAQTPSPQ